MRMEREKIETIDELNKKYYDRYNALSEAKPALGSKMFEFMSERLLEEYRADYRLYALKRDIDTARKTYQLEAEEYYLTPRLKRSIWSFFRRKRNKAAKLLDAETDLAVQQFFDAIEQEIEAETPQELNPSEELEAETAEDPDLSEEPEAETPQDLDPSEELEEETSQELDTAEDPDPDLSEKPETETSSELDTAALEALESARDKWRKLALFAEECSDEEEQELYAEEADWLSKVIALAERNKHTPKETDSGGGESPGEGTA